MAGTAIPVAAPVAAPPEAPVAPPPVDPGIAAPVEAPPSPAPAGETPPTPDAGDVLKDFFRLHVKSPEELQAALESVPEEFRAPITSEWERRGEQRVQTRAQEVQTAKDARMAVWQPLATEYPRAEAYLNAAVNRAKAGDPEALSNVDGIAQAINAYRNGAVAKIVLENEGYVPKLMDSLLPDLTKEEEAKLERPLYEFGRTGVASQVVPLIAELAIQRRETAAFEKGRQKGLKDLGAKERLAEAATNLQRIKNETVGVSPAGSQVSREGALSSINQEIAAFDPTQFPAGEREAKLADLWARKRQLEG